MKKNVSFPFAVFLILLYSAIQVVLLQHHEPWEDEAQAWLIARDLDVISIFKQMAYEGSPALWHVLLAPLAKAGLPYISEFILHLIIAVAAVTVFVLYAPFSRVTKVLFIFSYYMAYEYSIIARSYSLSILLLFIIAALYNRRFKYPLWYAFLIFLLFNTNVHSFFFATSLAILFVWELYRNHIRGGRQKIAALVMFIGGLLSFLQILSPPDNIYYGIISNINYLTPFAAVAFAFFPWHTSFFIPGELRIAFIFLSFFIFCVFIVSMLKKPSVLFLLLISFAGLLYIFAFKYPGAVRHHGLILIMFLFSMWIGTYYPESQIKLFNLVMKITTAKYPVLIMNICLAVSIVYCLKIQYMDYKYPFSGAEEMADFIMQNHLDHSITVAHRSVMCAALLPYFPDKQFWYADIEGYGTFVTYNKKYLAGKAISNKQIISRIETIFHDKSQVLLLSTSPLDYPESRGFRLLYKVDKNVFGYGKEKYFLYKPEIQE